MNTNIGNLSQESIDRAMVALEQTNDDDQLLDLEAAALVAAGVAQAHALIGVIYELRRLRGAIYDVTKTSGGAS